MASLLGALLEFFRILRSSATGHIKRFPRSCWTLLLACFGRKLSIWWFSWFNRSGAHGNTKSAYPSSPGSRGGSCSVSCSGSARRGYAASARVAASTVPASAADAANRQSRDGAESQPETPLSSSLSLVTLPADPPWAPSPDLNVISHWPGERSPTNDSSGDGPSTISISRSSSRGSQSDRSTRDHPRASYRQFGSGASRGLSRSPSPHPSPISPQNSVGVPSSPSHTREQSGSPTVQRARQGTTSIEIDIQNPSTESLPNVHPLISANAQESR